MVQVIENRTDLEGIVAGRGPDPDREAFELLDVDVEQAASVEGFADLLSGRAGGRVSVSVRRELLPEVSLDGARVRLRARLAGPGVVMAESDPGAVSVLPPGSPPSTLEL
jgi:hypothetical protein